jgi:hypothetical protein
MPLLSILRIFTLFNKKNKGPTGWTAQGLEAKQPTGQHW